MVIFTALVSGLFFFKEGRRQGLSLNIMDLILIVQGVALFGYVMSRVSTIYEDYLVSGQFAPIREWIKHSFHWYGAVFGVAIIWLVVVLFFSGIRKKQYLTFFNVLALTACLILFFGKFGCFLDGHHGCGGTATDLPWGVTYHWGNAYSETPMHPRQIYDMAVAGTMFLMIRSFVPFTLWTNAFLIGQSIWQLVAETMSPMPHLILDSFTLAQATYFIILIIAFIGCAAQFFTTAKS